MITVPEAARRARKDPETIRRWIRGGRLRAQKIGTQHVIDEADLELILEDDELPVPASWGWSVTRDGTPMPNLVAILRRQRTEH